MDRSGLVVHRSAAGAAPAVIAVDPRAVDAFVARPNKLWLVSTAKKILVVGFDPNLVDFSTLEMVAAHLTADKVLAGIAAENDRIRALGYDIERCHVAPDTDLKVVHDRLMANRWDAVVIGAGMRTRPEALLLFERVINLVHELAPGARIAFPTGPTDATEGSSAGCRWRPVPRAVSDRGVVQLPTRY